MTSESNNNGGICRLCHSKSVVAGDDNKCQNCLEKGDLVGQVVWDLVEETARNSQEGERVTFMLTGLSAVFLEGIARKSPENGVIDGNKSFLIAFNPNAADQFRISPPATTSAESAVHWRHSTEADVILFAPPDAEREGIGAGLRPVSRLDSKKIIDHTSAWLSLLDETGYAKSYLSSMLDGLRASQIYIDLEMWVDFILAIKNQGFSSPVDIRIQNAAPAFHIPIDGFTKLPSYKAESNSKVRSQDFLAAFQLARSEVGPFVYLTTPKQEPVDVQEVREKIRNFEHLDDQQTISALAVVESLLDDVDKISPGEWQDSQRNFCEQVSWQRIGSQLFSGGRKSNRDNLGAKTLRFLEGNFNSEVTDDDQIILNSLPNTVPKEPRDEEVEFFGRWYEKLNHPKAVAIFKAWQKRLFHKEVIGHDLQTAISEGFEALIVASSELLPTMSDPCVLIRNTQYNKAMFWEAMDTRILNLFKFEYLSMKGLTGKCIVWDVDACLKVESTESSNVIDSRKVDLELYLMEQHEVRDLAGIKPPPSNAPRVKATWQPGRKPKDETIGLALPMDIEQLKTAATSNAGLFRRQIISPLSSGYESRLTSMSLNDTNTFNDVTQEQEGKTYVTAVQPKQDLLNEISQAVKRLHEANLVDGSIAQEIESSIESFRNFFIQTITEIAIDPESGFKSDNIINQAKAFGKLCENCRILAKSHERVWKEVHPLVSEIGVVHSEDHELIAILTAWHPLRLAERRARILDLSNFIESVLTSDSARNADLTIAFETRRTYRDHWVYPECIVVKDKTMISVEDVQGYSLMIPAESVAKNQEALESTSQLAAFKFMEGVDEYLEIHPHEATNLSAAIFDSESQSLPKEIARLMAQRIQKDPNLRCDLVLTHHDQERMRQIYRKQNTLLQAENLSTTAKGFLSRLRIDVRPNQPTDEIKKERNHSGATENTIRDMDIVFLHDNISNHATPEWKREVGSADEFNDEFSLEPARKPRRCLSNEDSLDAGTYLTLNRPPSAVAHFYNLLYEIRKKAGLPDNFHGVLVRDVRFDDPQIKELVERSHKLAEWVVSYDRVSCRALLERCGIKIIRDISLPGSEGRVIISAGKIDPNLKRLISENLMKAFGINNKESEQFSDRVIDDVIQISGRKMLSASRFANASQEMIGLSLMRAQMEASLQGHLNENSKPIWISLDDYRGWFDKGKGKIADAIGVSIHESGNDFEIYLQVGEAKYVSSLSKKAELQNALDQVSNTLYRLNGYFIDNRDVISRNAWCSRLGDLLVNREGLVQRISDPNKRMKFIEQLNLGRVKFFTRGEAIVCVHDDHNADLEIEVQVQSPHIRYQILYTPIIKQTLQLISDGKLPSHEGLKDICWYPDVDLTSTGNGNDRSPVSGNDAEQSEVINRNSESLSDTVETTDIFPDSSEETEGQESKNTIVANPNHGQTGHGEEVDVQTSVSKSTNGNDGQTDSAESSIGDPIVSRPQFIPESIFTALCDMARDESNFIEDEESKTWAKEVAENIQRALSNFEMQANFAESDPRLTPNGALITFRGHPTLTIDRIERRTSELLTTHGIEVVNVRPGRGTISIFVKRPERANVPLASTWIGAEWPDREVGILTNFILGAREDVDRLLYLNLSENYAGYQEHGPHTLIAGETGSGKGVLIQDLILQLIMFNDPKSCELILVDPKKGVDFGWLLNTPHMRQEMITEMEDAQLAFNNLVVEMDKRYQILKEAGSNNISHYNQKRPPDEQMSRIFLVHDELGSWMAQERDYQDTILSAVSNLGMKARAAGIHLILVTQYANAESIPTKLRSNMGNRLCLKVQDNIGSRLVLGESGGEKLLGRGHLAGKLANENPPAGQKFFITQVPYANLDEIARLAEIAKSYWMGTKCD